MCNVYIKHLWHWVSAGAAFGTLDHRVQCQHLGIRHHLCIFTVVMGVTCELSRLVPQHQ